MAGHKWVGQKERGQPCNPIRSTRSNHLRRKVRIEHKKEQTQAQNAIELALNPPRIDDVHRDGYREEVEHKVPKVGDHPKS